MSVEIKFPFEAKGKTHKMQEKLFLQFTDAKVTEKKKEN